MKLRAAESSLIPTAAHRSLRSLLFGAFLLLFCLAGMPAGATSFVRFSGLEGDSEIAGRQGWSDLRGLKQKVVREENEDGTLGPPKIVGLEIGKWVDGASTGLSTALWTGQTFEEVVIEIVKPNADGTGEVFLRIRLCTVTITGREIEKKEDDEGGVVEETIQVKVGRVKVEHLPSGGVAEHGDEDPADPGSSGSEGQVPNPQEDPASDPDDSVSPGTPGAPSNPDSPASDAAPGTSQ